MSEITTVSEGGETVRSNSETPEQIKEILNPSTEKEEAKPDTSEAASVLGKASSEARKAKDAPEASKETSEELTEEQELAEYEKLEKEGKLGKAKHDSRAMALEKARKVATLKRELEQEKAEKQRIARENAELRPRAPEPKEEAKEPGGDPRKPKFADFLPKYESYEEAIEAYQDARDAYREQVASERQSESARSEFILKAVDSFTGRIAKAAEADSGFLERTAELAKALQPSFMRPPGTPIQPRHIISDRIIKSEKNVELMEHFAKNRSELQRIANAGTREDVLYELAKVEAGLGAVKQASVPPVVVPSKASPPVSPVAGSPHTVESMPGPDASYEEHKRFWTAKDKAAARR